MGGFPFNMYSQYSFPSANVSIVLYIGFVSKYNRQSMMYSQYDSLEIIKYYMLYGFILQHRPKQCYIIVIPYIYNMKMYGILMFIPVLPDVFRSEEHTSELQSRFDLVCRLLLEK